MTDTTECPYCGEEVKTRGLKNHIRMSGGEHPDDGELPDEPDPDKPDISGDEVTEVSPTDLAPDPKESGENTESGDDYPFDPNDPDAYELDGSEELYVVADGDVRKAGVSEGDYLLLTDAGPVLWDHKTDDRYEVKTA